MENLEIKVTEEEKAFFEATQTFNFEADITNIVHYSQVQTYVFTFYITSHEAEDPSQQTMECKFNYGYSNPYNFKELIRTTYEYLLDERGHLDFANLIGHQCSFSIETKTSGRGVVYENIRFLRITSSLAPRGGESA